MKFSELQRLQRMEGITVLSADERIEQLEARLHTVTKERDDLQAKIAEMEKQEPVKHEFQGRDGAWYPFIDQRHYENTVADGTWPIRALYALPGAQTQGDSNVATD